MCPRAMPCSWITKPLDRRELVRRVAAVLGDSAAGPPSESSRSNSLDIPSKPWSRSIQLLSSGGFCATLSFQVIVEPQENRLQARISY
jgi:DNA-binding response OmpR family regulator